MTISFQQLRSAIPGAQPQQLDPGQVAFNVSDGTMYLGTGTDTKIDFSGAQVLPAPPAGKGWLQVLLERAALSEFFLDNPTSTGGAAPTNEQVLTWNSTEGKAEWQDAGTGFSYLTDTATVAASIGATTSEKISAAIGNPGYIGINASCIVTGDPGTTYEGLYIWSGTEWRFASHFAFNTASQVPGVNPMNLLQESTQAILNALKGVDDSLQSQITSNDGDIATLQGEMSQAQTDIVDLQINKLNIASNIPNPGQILSFDGNGQLWVDDSQGDVTGVSATAPITVDNTDPQVPVVGIDAATTVSSGAVQLSNAIDSTDETQASTPLATKTAYDLAAAAVPRSTYAAEGDIVVGSGAGTFGPLSVGTEGQVLTVSGGVPAWTDDSPGDVTSVTGTAPIQVNNTDPQTPVVSVDLATTATPGVVQIELTGNMTLVGGVIDVPDASTTVKGAVQLNNTLSSNSTSQALTAAQGLALQNQINTLSLASSVTLAGGYDASTGFVDGVTAAGTAAGFVDGQQPPLAAAGNADFYLICVVAGNTPSSMDNGDWLLSSETSPGVYSYIVLGVGARPASASYTQAGIVQLADAAAVLSGTSDTLAITPQALQDNIIDSVTTVNSSQMASATAVNTAYVAATTAQTAANAAQATANAALPKAGGTMTGTIVAQNVNVQNGYSVQFNGGVNGSLDGITDSVSTTDSTIAASATAVKAAADAAAAAQVTANAALPKAGGTMTGNITFQDAGEGVVFNGGSQIFAISNSVTTTSATTAASSTAVKSAYDIGAGALSEAQGAQLTADNAQATADAAIPDATFTTAGELLYGTGSATYSVLPIGTDGQQLIVSGGALAWGQGLAGATTTENTYLGEGSLPALTTGTDNTAVGVNTGNTLDSGSRNILIGDGTGDGLTSSSNNVAVGFNALSGANGSDNVVIGNLAGQLISGGNQNVIIGSLAGDGITAADELVAIGYNALSASAGTSGTVAVGSTSLRNLTTGFFNTAVGYRTGQVLTTGSNNTFIGDRSGQACVSGSDNTFLGFRTGYSTLGSSNIFIGSTAGENVTTGSSNTIIGDLTGSTTLTNNLILAAGTTIKFQANENGAWSANGVDYGTSGQVLTSGGSSAAPVWSDIPSSLTGFTTADNTALGEGSMDQLTTGVDNTAIGVNTGTSLSSGSRNVLIGDGSGDGLTAGNNNTAIGYNTFSGTGGSNNVLLGYQAGLTMTSGNSNVVIGANAGDAITGANSVVAIGQGALSGGAGASGTVAIGESSMAALTTGQFNTGLGYRTGLVLSTGSNNTFVGDRSGQGANTGSNCTYLGYRSGYATTGGNNTFLGTTAGDGVTTGSGNTIVGVFSGTTTLTNNLILAAGTTIKFQANENGAWSADGANYGTSGQILTSGGTSAAPTWQAPIWKTATGSSSTTTPYTLLTLPLATVSSVQMLLEARDTTDATYHNDTYYVITDGTTTDVQEVAGARLGGGVSPVTVSATVSGTDLLIQITNHAAHLITVQANYTTTKA